MTRSKISKVLVVLLVIIVMTSLLSACNWFDKATKITKVDITMNTDLSQQDGVYQIGAGEQVSMFSVFFLLKFAFSAEKTNKKFALIVSRVLMISSHETIEQSSAGPRPEGRYGMPCQKHTGPWRHRRGRDVWYRLPVRLDPLFPGRREGRCSSAC